MAKVAARSGRGPVAAPRRGSRFTAIAMVVGVGLALVFALVFSIAFGSKGVAQHAKALHAADEALRAATVARAQAGDLPAFEELVQKYQREVYGLACRMVSDAEEAKDLAQQAFLQAFVHIRSFRQDAQFRTWLFRIAINQCYNFLYIDICPGIKFRTGNCKRVTS